MSAGPNSALDASVLVLNKMFMAVGVALIVLLVIGLIHALWSALPGAKEKPAATEQKSDSEK